ncbi:hypothetical protein MA16_Dca012262 [Dendrobium catenatum]|uniref:Uncharacterized protein n=1 Tax=Dendrobium catenatum TaxID=906689 RepID=A0A2I0WR49_9ASPA|nr:hypothetical protein MA16_Dca012262 [Dendrobium catenatum]
MVFCNLCSPTSLLCSKLAALQSISLEKLKPELPFYYSSEKWPFRCTFLFSSSCSLSAFCCRASMAEATAEVLTLRDICGGKVPEHILKRYLSVFPHLSPENHKPKLSTEPVAQFFRTPKNLFVRRGLKL